jgi:hypothetical protein
MYELPHPRLSGRQVNLGAFVDAESYLSEVALERGRSIGVSLGGIYREQLSRGRLGARAHSMDSIVTRAEARGRVLISIDLNQPLDPQFTAIKKELGKAQSQARARPDHYELALRLLDARSADRQQQATWKEIESVISNEHGRKTLTSLQLKRKHRDAVRLQKRFLKPYYHHPIKQPRQRDCESSHDE